MKSKGQTSTGDRYIDLVGNISDELKLLSKKELKEYLSDLLWGSPFKEMQDTLDSLVKIRVERVPKEKKVKKVKSFIGRSIYLPGNSSRKYLIEKEEAGMVTLSSIGDTNNKVTTEYLVSDLHRYLEKGTWKLVKKK